MSRKKIVPKRVTQPVLFDNLSEKRPKNDEPAGSVAATRKMEEHIKRDQPAM
jgi:hypothetical protein